MAVIGIDLGGTKLSGALFQKDGTMMRKTLLSLEKRGGEEAGQFVVDLVKSLVDIAGMMSMKIDAVGCCVPGIAYPKTGRVWAPNIAGWDDYPLLEKVQGNMPDSAVKVIIDNDRACAIAGEVWQGSARGCNDAIFLAVGTGIGAGIMTGGRILRGADDIAGSIGWLALDRPYLDKYSGIGCFEYYASGEGLVRVTRDLLRDNPACSGLLSLISPKDLTAHAIFDAYRANDPIAITVLSQAVEFWGMTVGNLVSLFNPEKIIFGGGIFGPAAIFLDDILTEAKKWAQPVSIRKVELNMSILGGDAGLYGAAFLGMNDKTM
jgi:glucokinase